MSTKDNSKNKKVNPFTLTRPTAKTVTKTFTDPLQPGVELTLHLKTLDQAEVIQAQEIAERYIARYVGYEDVPAEMLFPMVDNQVVAISRTLVQNAAVLVAMQTKPDEAYTVEEFIALSVTMPSALNEAIKAISELNKTQGDSKNA